MENKNDLPDRIPANRRRCFGSSRTKQEFFNSSGRVDIECSRNVSASILVVKATIYHMISGDLIIVFAVQQGSKLLAKSVNGHDIGKHQTYGMAVDSHKPVFSNTAARKNLPMFLIVTEPW